MHKKLINYGYSLSEHPLIAEHPLYKSILESKLDNFSFVQDNFISSVLTIIPTYYKPLNINHAVVIEDYITLFFPYIHNGSNFRFTSKEEWVTAFKNLFERKEFKGIICHMKQTLESIKQIFNSEIINNKLFYLPLATKSIEEINLNVDPSNIKLLFTNSFGGTENNFPLRGGLEVILAFKNLVDSGFKNITLKIVGSLKLEEDLLQWLQQCPQVEIYGSNIVRHNRNMVTDNLLHEIMLDTDIFLIPACRIHSMSVVKAMSYGLVVLGSDGWGFNEFIDKEFCCDGQTNASYIEQGLLKEKYSLFLESPNTRLVKSIEDKLKFLVANPDLIRSTKEDNLNTSKTKFSPSSRDIILESILEKMTI